MAPASGEAASARRRAASSAVAPATHSAAGFDLLEMVYASLRPQLEALRGALASDKPSAVACDAALEVMRALAPLSGPLEPALCALARTAERSSKVHLSGGGLEGLLEGTELIGAHAMDVAVGAHYFEVVERQRRAVATLTAERDEACARVATQMRQFREGDASLAATRAQLAEQSDRIERLVKEEGATRVALERARTRQVAQAGLMEQTLATNGHAVRMQVDEQRRLRERLATLKDEERRRATYFSGEAITEAAAAAAATAPRPRGWASSAREGRVADDAVVASEAGK